MYCRGLSPLTCPDSEEARTVKSGLRKRNLCVVARGGVEPPTYRFSGGRSYQLSYLAPDADGRRGGFRNARLLRAVLTGFEPATFTLTG
jgi:hypothetical protein